MILATLHLHQTDFNFSSKTPSTYKVKVSDKPVPKENSILCRVTIEGKYQNKEIEAYHAALISLTKNEQRNFDYIRGDSEGFVNIPLSIKGVVFSCFLREDTEKPMIKISLRSVGTFPCNQLAAEFFNGGGHLNASGGEFYGTMDEARATFEEALEKFAPLLIAKE